jgi:voltage-gated potassium channel
LAFKITRIMTKNLHIPALQSTFERGILERDKSSIEKSHDTAERRFTLKKVRRRLALAFYAPYYLLKRVRFQLMILGSMFLIGALLFMWYQDLDFLTALLGSVSTITTIGIYAPNIVLMDPVEKALLIVVFIVAVGSAASLLQSTVSVALKRGIMSTELAQRIAKGMERHVIVVGYKFLGKYMVENLHALNVEFLVIVKDESQLDILAHLRIPALYTPITHIYETLKRVNVEKAAILISTMDNDGENMLAVLAAKKLNSNIRTISIVNDKELVGGVRNAGADLVIPYLDIMGQILTLSSVSRTAGILFTEHLKSGHVAEFKIEASGITYGDIKGICPILMISRNHEFTYDMNSDFQLKEEDTIYALVDHESIGTFKDKLRALNLRALRKRSKP